MGAMNFGPMGPYGAYPMSQMMMGQQHGMGGAGPYGGGYYPQQQQGGMPHGGGMPPMNPTMMGCACYNELEPCARDGAGGDGVRARDGAHPE